MDNNSLDMNRSEIVQELVNILSSFNYENFKKFQVSSKLSQFYEERNQKLMRSFYFLIATFIFIIAPMAIIKIFALSISSDSNWIYLFLALSFICLLFAFVDMIRGLYQLNNKRPKEIEIITDTLMKLILEENSNILIDQLSHNHNPTKNQFSYLDLLKELELAIHRLMTQRQNNQQIAASILPLFSILFLVLFLGILGIEPQKLSTLWNNSNLSITGFTSFFLMFINIWQKSTFIKELDYYSDILYLVKCAQLKASSDPITFKSVNQSNFNQVQPIKVPIEREKLIRSLKGKYAKLLSSTEEFIQQKQEEIDWEQRNQ